MHRRCLVQLRRLPLDTERREALRIAGMLPSDLPTRSVTAWDYVYVDASGDEEAVALAVTNASIPLDRGEPVTAAESLPDGSTRPLPPSASVADAGT